MNSIKSLLCLLFLAGAAYAADPKPAASPTSADYTLTLDAAAIFNGYYKVQDAQAKFQASEEEASNELKAMYEEGLALAKEVQELQAKANNQALKEDARKKFEDEAKAKEAAVQQKELGFSQYQQQVSRTLAQQQETLMKTFTEDVKNTAESIRRERGASIVLNIAGSSLVTADPKLDVTQIVLDRLNSTKPKPAPKSDASKTAPVAPVDKK